MSHASTFLDEVVETVRRIEPATIEALCDELVNLRDRDGRLFILGVGGSAGNAGHAVNDFRKLCGIEAYAPTDNVSELTARTNDEGWPTVFSEWLKVSRANSKDAILIFSVGGGNLEKNVSPNLVSAIGEAKARGLRDARHRRPRRRLYQKSRRLRRRRSRPSRRAASRRMRKRSRPWSGIAWCRTRSCRTTPPNGEGRLPRSRWRHQRQSGS